jgi:Mn2+/Fe2+ NRAMP family transporter
MAEITADRPVKLPMVGEIDPEFLAQEEAYLREANSRGLLGRLGAYVKLSGPGWLQGAMTLGGGSAASSLFAGTLGGYKFLWVQPLGMVTGIVMLMAITHLTLSTRLRPFDAVARFSHPALAWMWAVASLLASIVFCFSQFSLAESVFTDVAQQYGVIAPDRPSLGFTLFITLAILLFTFFITLQYGKSLGWIKKYETALKLMVAMIIISFAAVVVMVDVEWGKVFRGFIPSKENFPKTEQEIEVVISAFANSVGINMTFLLPYTLAARGWGREHRGLAKFDLWTGLFFPFMFATSLIVIASAVTLHGTFDLAAGKNPGAKDLSVALEPVMGQKASHLVFGLGVVGMTVSTITLLMLVSGFIVSELGRSHSRKLFLFGAILPSVGALGPIYWNELRFYMAIPVSNLCYFMMPIAYMAFILCMNRKSLLGASAPTGLGRVVWNSAMLAVLGIVTFGGFYKVHFGLGGAVSWSDWGAWSFFYVGAMALFFAWGIFLYLHPRKEA